MAQDEDSKNDAGFKAPPTGRVAMRQAWDKLLFLHWEVPAGSLRRLVPDGLELDLFEGKAYVGLIPFTMTGVRPVWAPAVRGLSNFHETNVRTYVRHARGGPGVWFLSLDAANAAAVALARALFHLPYYLARMSLIEADDGAVAYRSRRVRGGASCDIRARPVGLAQGTEPGTLDAFLIERYVFYAAHGRKIHRGLVRHVPYAIRDAEILTLEENLLDAAGIDRPDAAPHARFAGEVRVDVFPLRDVARLK